MKPFTVVLIDTDDPCNPDATFAHVMARGTKSAAKAALRQIATEGADEMDCTVEEEMERWMPVMAFPGHVTPKYL